jgi:para-aminobenzoate synthetase component 1
MRWPLHGSRPIHLERLETLEKADEAHFLSQAEIRASQNPSALLLSGGELRPAGENRYSIAAWDPFLALRSKGNLNRIDTAGQSFEIAEDPLSVLDRLCESMHPCFGPASLPFCGGAVGYFAYDLKNSIDRLPTSACDDLDLPDLFVFWPSQIEVYDRKERKLSRIALWAEEDTTQKENPPGPLLERSGQGFLRSDSRCGAQKGEERVSDWFEAGALQSNFTHDEYLAAVSRVRDYIRQGDVYQVNLSQRFQFPLKGDPFRLWKSLFDINPAPFYAYINAVDHHILSTSMERFLFRKEELIETRPIKGTRKRGRTRQEDEAFVADLLSSPKDDAELSMIVDLLRNDLGRICSPKTIRVLEHKRLETYRNVHHLVSIVTGALRPGTSPGLIIRATFPGGSITGCPKIRSMEIIDELEPNVRHVYTGAIGYIGWHDNLDLNVAIRTAIVKGGTCYFSVGGGIVYDSIEEDEYQETLHKGRTLFELIETLGSKP